jgi:hypothetical protein
MNSSDILFLELLRSAIWKQPANPAMFAHTDEETWRSLFEYAATQSAAALITDGVSTLPPNCAPPRLVSIDLLLYTDNVEEQNAKFNRVLAKISDDYASLGLPFILLKGQGNALYYPNPAHRNSGDIDLFFYGDGDYEKAKQWVAKNGYPCEEETLYHLGYHYDGIIIEIHNCLKYFTNEKYNKPLKDKVDAVIGGNMLETIKIGETTVKVLPAGFNAFYVFEHFFHHFTHTGIGVRQICDWLLLLSARHGDINKEAFTATARQFDLLKPMRVFAHAAIKYLGAQPDIFPFDLGADSRFSDLVMNDVLRGGDFGYHHSGIGGKLEQSLRQKWHRYIYSLRRASLFAGMSSQHIAWLPIHKILVFLKAQSLKTKQHNV